MASLNRVTILGNLGQDPELRYTPNQVPVVTLSIATTEFRKTADGQRQEQTDWHRVIVWNRQAENCHKYLKKGRSVLIEGRISYRSWDDKSGQKRYTTEIIASNVQFMPAAGGRDSWRESGEDYQGGFDGGSYGSDHDPFAAESTPRMDTNNSTTFPKADSGARQNPNKMSLVPDFDDMPF
ncbi:MAG: single-stranded DNA-binding protein [Deltaproteobacteria bacterium]|nr:single-stranded DNA-binding protein [Deltaproteobacteria bacterium]